MIDVVKIPVTYKAEQHVTDTKASDFDDVLEGTRVRVVHGGRGGLTAQFPPPPYRYVETGPSQPIWVGDWVVVSSLGEVRVLPDEAFKKEFLHA